MTQDRQTPTSAPLAASRLARAGFERPVEHLHFDRRARVWWSHTSFDADARRVGAASHIADEVSA